MDYTPALTVKERPIEHTETGKWEVFDGGKTEAGYVFASYFATGCAPGPDLKWTAWEEHPERFLELE